MSTRANRVRLPGLLIELATTSDLNGEPWPPTGLMIGWVLVRSVDGQSLWRRISIATAGDANTSNDD